MRPKRNVSAKRSPPMLLKLALLSIGLLLIVAAFSWAVETLDVPPRTLANHVERRASGHNNAVLAISSHVADLLLWLDRSSSPSLARQELRTSSETRAATTSARARTVLVATAADAIRAIERADAGDAITFVPGRYRFTGSGISANRPGSAAAAIVVRADHPGSVVLEFDMTEGFVVSAPYWTFENLSIRGACAQHADCEHAFHVVARAHHFIARNNDVAEFNAHFKINGAGAIFPDDGLIEGNTLSNTGVRATDSSVTPIDLVAASRWTIRGNRISDFSKAGADKISYGAFAKGGGSHNLFERNIVLCENLVRGAPGQRVGIALGGGGTGKQYCRDARCITEQDGSSIRSNLIMSCSDDGIYINRSATSVVRHNTLIDTAGISVRFAESSAEVEGNLVDGTIRRRDGGALHAVDNIDTSMTRLYLGSHPVRDLFNELSGLSWATGPPRRQVAEQPTPDLCGVQRPPNPAYGAFEDFSKCTSRAFAAEAPAR